MPSTNSPSSISGGFSADEQRLLNKVLDLATTFGPLGGAVKIKLPDSKNYLIVHGSLLIEKSYFCRGALARTEKKGAAKAKELSLPSASVTTLAHFLKWIYTNTVLSAPGPIPVKHPGQKVAWPDLVHVWLFASSIDLPALQNHGVDILVDNMHGFLEMGNRTQKEIDLIRAAFNLIWRGKSQAQSGTEQRKADGPLRALMMDWFANPLYQTKADANHLWAGGLSRSFYRDLALHAMDKNFSEAVDGAGDSNDAQAHLKTVRDVSRLRLGRLWEIKPDKYHVEDDA